MSSFFTMKNVATIGGVILSFVIPHLIFEDDYEIEVVETDVDVDVQPEIIEAESAEEQ